MNAAEVLEKLEVEFEAFEIEVELEESLSSPVREGRARAFGECRAVAADMRREIERAGP